MDFLFIGVSRVTLRDTDTGLSWVSARSQNYSRPVLLGWENAPRASGARGGRANTGSSHEDNQREAGEPSALTDITSEPNSGRSFVTHPSADRNKMKEPF